MMKICLLIIITFISGCGVFDDSYDYLKYSSPYNPNNPNQRYEGPYRNINIGGGFDLHPDFGNIQISPPAGIK